MAAPVKDTIKIVDTKGWVKDTLDRNLLWSAQTPQAFDYSLIRKAYELRLKKKPRYEIR